MLRGKTAVITGASRGIGAAICEKLASLGADVALIYAGNEAAARAVQKPAAECMFPLPDHFKVEISFKEHAQAKNAASYPGVAQTGAQEIAYEADDYMDVLRMIDWVL